MCPSIIKLLKSKIIRNDCSVYQGLAKNLKFLGKIEQMPHLTQ